MLSRVAENLYWMARYVERAENTARMINVNAHLLLDLPKRMRLGWEPLVLTTGADAQFHELYKQADQRSVIRFLVADERYTGSMINSLNYARENARTMREVLPSEAWEQINDLYLQLKENVPGGLAEKQRYEFLKGMIGGAQRLTGLLAGSMSQDTGYFFIRLGRNLERADMTTRVIDVRSVNLLPDLDEDLAPVENIQWMSVLNTLSAYQMYRQQVGKPVRRADVIAFLFKDERFPRAFAHCLGEVTGALKALPRNRAPLAMAREFSAEVAESAPEELDQQGLHDYIDQLQLKLGQLHSGISDNYFALG